MSKRKLQPTAATLTLTPPAANKIKQLLKDKPKHAGVKVGVPNRSCNGLSYTLECMRTKGDPDEVRVSIEKRAHLTLLGAEDCVEDTWITERKNNGQGAHYNHSCVSGDVGMNKPVLSVVLKA